MGGQHSNLLLEVWMRQHRVAGCRAYACLCWVPVPAYLHSSAPLVI